MTIERNDGDGAASALGFCAPLRVSSHVSISARRGFVGADRRSQWGRSAQRASRLPSGGARLHVRRRQSRTVRASAEYDYDLFVIGAGSGGVRASRIAASHGARVAVAEEAKYGGTCVNVGCVPKKLFVYGSHYREYAEEAKAFGLDFELKSLDWKTLISNKNNEISRLNGIYEKMLKKAEVEIFDGRATIEDAHTVVVNGKKHTAEYILVAVGGTPFVPDFPGREHVITSNEAFFLDEMPRRVIVNGGGYIAVEFANIFHGYGAQTVQLYRKDLFLRGFDTDVRQMLADQMRERGMDVRFNEEIKEVEKLGDGSLRAKLSDGSTIDADVILFATGRTPKLQGLGLENAGVEIGEKQEVVVDEYSRTNVPSVYAIGDCTNRVALTPVALAEGHCVADTMFGNNPRRVDYEYIPSAVFCTPTIGTCGLLEEQAREQFGEIDVYKADFRPLKNTMTQMPERTFMKLVVRRDDQRVVGCHILEPAAGETIQLVAVAMKAGATKQDFDSTIGVHPTSSEELVTMRTKEPDP